MLFMKGKLLMMSMHFEMVNKKKNDLIISNIFFIDLTQAMLLQEPQGLREAIARTKNSVHATALADEIRQAENLLTKLK
jgi:hypothetical protein